MFLALLQNPVQAVTMAWDLNADPETAGYNVYYGAAPRTYTNMTNTANKSVTIGNLVGGVTYFFAVTAYNSLGLESDYSSETSYTVPAALAILNIRSGHGEPLVLSATGPVGHTYTIQATKDFKIWTNIGTVTVPASGLLEFTDPNAANFSERFYRTQ